MRVHGDARDQHGGVSLGMLPWGLWLGGAGGGGARGQSVGVWDSLGLLGSQSTPLLHVLVESTEQAMAVVSLLVPSTSCSSSASSSSSSGSLHWDTSRSHRDPVGQLRQGVWKSDHRQDQLSPSDVCPNPYGFGKLLPEGLAFQLLVLLCPRVRVGRGGGVQRDWSKHHQRLRGLHTRPAQSSASLHPSGHPTQGRGSSAQGHPY